MRFKRGLFFICLLICLFTIASVVASENHDLSEKSSGATADEFICVEDDSVITDGGNGDVKTFDDLKTQIEDVEDGGILNLTQDYIYKSGSSDGITINKNITINGNNHRIDGASQSRIFKTFDGNIILNNLILVNGHADKGGAIFVNKTVILNNVTFENNHAQEGGSVYTMANVTLDHCVFDGGYAKTGAAIYVYERSTTGSGPDINPDIGPDGGPDSGPDDDEEVDPDTQDFPEPRVIIYDNATDFDDEWIEVPYGCVITNSIFKNYSNAGLSIIYVEEKQAVSITNSTFANSTSEYATAIYTCLKSTIYMGNDTFVNLHANRSGGAIGFYGFTMLKIENSTFDNVSSEFDGGVMNADGEGWIAEKRAQIYLYNSTFKNSKSKYGSVIAQFGAILFIDNSTFIDNYAQNNALIYSANSRLKITNSKFKNNKLNSTGGDVTKAMIYLYDSNAIVNNSQFIDNSDLIFSLFGQYNITNSIFDNKGRVIYAASPRYLVLENNTYNSDTLVENVSADAFFVFIVNSTGVKLDLIENNVDVVNLPSRFDSRDWGWVTILKDQWISGACWVFSTCAALETALLKSAGVEYNISVQNIHKNLLRHSQYGSDWSSEGGLSTTAAHFILSWYGALPIEYGEFDMIGKVNEPIISSDAIHVQDLVWLDSRNNNVSITEPFKRAIMKYGAITSGIFIDYDDSKYFNRNTSAWYYNETELTTPSHAICVVGWDDNYPASNFNIIPPGNGAWIIKDSYGPSSCDNGYLYVSYYDTVFNNDSFEVAFVFENTENYTKNYQTDISGEVNIKNKSESYSYKNSYTAIEDDFIAAVGTYFDALGEEYSFKIYVNGVLKHTQSGKAPFKGYHTIKLTKYVPVKKGDVFTIVMDTHSMPLIINSNIPLHQGISYATNGTGWIDLSTIRATVTLKAYTKPLVDLKTTIEANSVNTVYNGGKYLIVNVKDVFGDALKGVKVTIKLSDGKTKTMTTDSKGQVKFLTDGLAPKTYTATITTEAFGKYIKTTINAKITVKKATLKLTAKKKTFKHKVKTKKYAVTLKDNTGKAMKKVKLTLKVKGKTFTAKTNSKGKAIFKIKKFTRKGKFTAKIVYKGNAYYNKLTKKVRIKIK